MTPEDLRSQNKEELDTQIKERKEELLRLRIQKSTAQLEKTHRLKEVRRDIARIFTILRQKEEKEV